MGEHTEFESRSDSFSQPLWHLFANAKAKICLLLSLSLVGCGASERYISTKNLSAGRGSLALSIGSSEPLGVRTYILLIRNVEKTIETPVITIESTPVSTNKPDVTDGLGNFYVRAIHLPPGGYELYGYRINGHPLLKPSWFRGCGEEIKIRFQIAEGETTYLGRITVVPSEKESRLLANDKWTARMLVSDASLVDFPIAKLQESKMGKITSMIPNEMKNPEIVCTKPISRL